MKSGGRRPFAVLPGKGMEPTAQCLLLDLDVRQDREAAV